MNQMFSLPLFTAVKSCMVPNLLILLYIRSQDLGLRVIEFMTVKTLRVAIDKHSFRTMILPYISMSIRYPFNLLA
jgi:hypothetical protein